MARVFVNCVDSYVGNIISKVVEGKRVGGTISGGDENSETQHETSVDSADDLNQPRNIDVASYEIVGTLSNSDASKPDWVAEVIEREDISAILSCDIIIYHVTGLSSQIDEATTAVQSLHDQMSNFTTQKVFICVSSILTWARSKPLDPDEPDVPFAEEDYRRRRPHPNFKDQISLEKVVIKLGKTDKSKLITYVVAAGLLYGQGENLFHFMFKNAWYGVNPFLEVYGDGNNIVPTIHVLDMASVVLNIADNRPKTRYILALDDSQNTLQEMVKAISVGLGPGNVKNVLKEDALLSKEMSQCDYDHLLVNLLMEPSLIKDMTIDWKAESGLVENISKVIKEYKEIRGLLPIRVCVLGPPAVGKSYIISRLCKEYKLHHIKIADVIKEAIEKLERTAARADLEDSNEDEVDDDDGEAQRAQEFLDLLKEDFEENKHRYSDQYIIEFYKKKLLSMPCQNQGFVLDGFPKTYEQAKTLFAFDDENEEDEDEQLEEDGEKPQYNKKIMPEVIVSLTASDDFLKNRVMNLPQIEVEDTHNTEEGFLRRLDLFRSQNEEDNTVLNYFDENEFHPEVIDIEKDNLTSTFDKLYKWIGEPRNYGPTPEEKAEIERKALAEKVWTGSH